MIESESQSSEDLAIRRKRLIYRANHRGMKELDIIIGGFANRALGEFGEGDLDAFEALLSEEEVFLHAWLVGLEPYAEHPHKSLIDAIRTSQLGALAQGAKD